MEKIPQEGFIKISRDQQRPVSMGQKVALNRKGNEFFNNGEHAKAKRIFITTGYTDGLIRLGDYYFENDDPLEALRMYYLAPAQNKKERLIEDMAAIVQKWLKEEKD